MNEVRLKEVINDIIDAIESRKTEDRQAREFNRVQRMMFKRMLIDVTCAVNGDYSEETEDILLTWKQSYNGEKGYYFMNYIYGIDKNKQYSLS